MPDTKPPACGLSAVRFVCYSLCLGIGLLTSCKKHTNLPSAAALMIRIDSARIIGFNHLKVSISYSTAELNGNIRVGVCWSTSPNPVVDKESIIQPRPDYNRLDTLTSGLDSNTIYHLRAFCIVSRDTIYGSDTTLKTGALRQTFAQQYSSTNNLEFRQSASLGPQGYIVLSQADPLLNGGPGANLTQFDLSGNRLWTMDYAVGLNKYPILLLPVSDGFLFASDSLASGMNVPVLSKTDLAGNLLWNKAFPIGPWPTQHIAQLSPAPGSPDIVLSFVADSFQVGSNSIISGPLYQLTIDPNGNLQSTSSYDAPSLWSLFSFTPNTPDGYLAVLNHFSNTGEEDGMTLQGTSTGNTSLWSETYLGGRALLDPVGALVDQNENYTVLVWKDGQNFDTTWILNLDAKSGAILWQTTYPGSTVYGLQYGSIPNALVQGPANNYYEIGEGALLKTDPIGNYIWDIKNSLLNLPLAGAIYVSPTNEITIIGVKGNGQTGTAAADQLFFAKLQEY